MAKSSIRYNYITVEVPQDCFSDANAREQQAIHLAREQMKSYVVPCSWHVVRDDGTSIRVCRKSRKVTGRTASLAIIDDPASEDSEDVLAEKRRKVRAWYKICFLDRKVTE